MTTTLLIDADTMAYTAALGAEYNHDFNGVIARGADLNKAFEVFHDGVEHLKEFYAADAVRIALTGPTNFRKAVLPTYKSKRGPKPICLGELKDKVIAEMGGVIRDNLEADDIIGIWATHPTLIGGDKVVVSIDKDMRTIPCKLANGKDPVEQLSISSANYCFLKQVLTGDTVDGYTGLPGCGPKGASKILMPFVDDKGGFLARPAWAAVVAAYEKEGLTADDALVQARVARILRARDYDFQKREPILWTPPAP